MWFLFIITCICACMCGGAGRPVHMPGCKRSKLSKVSVGVGPSLQPIFFHLRTSFPPASALFGWSCGLCYSLCPVSPSKSFSLGASLEVTAALKLREALCRWRGLGILGFYIWDGWTILLGVLSVRLIRVFLMDACLSPALPETAKEEGSALTHLSICCCHTPEACPGVKG